jgi:biotin synthase-like enzyme
VSFTRHTPGFDRSAEAPRYTARDLEGLIESALGAAKQNCATRFRMGAAWRGPS